MASDGCGPWRNDCVLCEVMVGEFIPAAADVSFCEGVRPCTNPPCL